MKLEQVKKNMLVVLTLPSAAPRKTQDGNLHEGGQTYKVLGLQGTAVRLSRTTDHAKLTILADDFVPLMVDATPTRFVGSGSALKLSGNTVTVPLVQGLVDELNAANAVPEAVIEEATHNPVSAQQLVEFADKLASLPEAEQLVECDGALVPQAQVDVNAAVLDAARKAHAGNEIKLVVGAMASMETARRMVASEDASSVQVSEAVTLEDFGYLRDDGDFALRAADLLMGMDNDQCATLLQALAERLAGVFVDSEDPAFKAAATRVADARDALATRRSA